MKIVIKRLTLSTIIFIITYILIFVSRNNHEIIETYYSRGLFRGMTALISPVFSIIPVSTGEILLVLLAGGLVYQIIQLIKRPTRDHVAGKASTLVLWLVTANLLFWAMWGLNNFRTPLEQNLSIEVNQLSVEDLMRTADYLVEKAVELEPYIVFDDSQLPVYPGGINGMMKNSRTYFNTFAQKHDFLNSGRYSQPKPMLFSEGMSHLNYTGIYNPFTTEPNVNVNIPIYRIPFVALHEIAHQRGIAGEREANFVAFLAAVEEGDSFFQYSGYYSALIYVTNAILREDLELYQQIRNEFSEHLNAVFQYDRAYWSNYQTVAADIGEMNNERFLKATGQPEGTKSYGLVVDLIVAYVQDKMTH